MHTTPARDFEHLDRVQARVCFRRNAGIYGARSSAAIVPTGIRGEAKGDIAVAEHSSLAPSGRGTADRSTLPAGIAFVVLFVVGLLIGSDSPNPDAPDAEWTAWFDDSGHRTLQIVGALLMVLAALAFVVFITGFVRRLRAETMNDGAAQVAHGVGIVVAAAIAIGGIAINQISAAIEIGDIPIPNPDVLRTAEQFGYGVVLLLGGWARRLRSPQHRSRREGPPCCRAGS